MQVYCSSKHANNIGSIFCTHCGEPLPMNVGQIIDRRYEIVRLLGQGGFGRSYLAVDLQKSRQECVLKEFAPQVTKPEELQKAKELFEREASVLKKIQHPQIPRFHASLFTKIGVHDFFFLVQDYINGDNYEQLLEKRHSQGKTFSEEEVIDLCKKILPVLSYIHGLDIVHRDISPDNLILRHSDNLPVLIDFGGVKQLPASKGFWFTKLAVNVTLLGKQGYAPEEQIRQGKTFKNSDLYALAVTALVLLTGKEPQLLYDTYNNVWLWQKQINISPGLEKIFQKMLAHQPSDRYQTADQVLHELLKQPQIPNSRHQGSLGKTHNPYITNLKTMVVAPGKQRVQAALSNLHNQTQVFVQQTPIPQWLRPFATSFLGTTVIVLISLSSWTLGNLIVSSILSHHLPAISLPQLPWGKKPGKPANSQVQKIFNHSRQLKISSSFLISLVDEVFYAKNPNLKGRSLTENPGDANLREQWYSMADDLLNKIEQANLSVSARIKLGKYTSADYKDWKERATAGKLGKYHTIDQLKADTYQKFDQLFPDQQHGKLNQQTFLQIWYAIASDKVHE